MSAGVGGTVPKFMGFGACCMTRFSVLDVSVACVIVILGEAQHFCYGVSCSGSHGIAMQAMLSGASYGQQRPATWEALDMSSLLEHGDFAAPASWRKGGVLRARLTSSRRLQLKT